VVKVSLLGGNLRSRKCKFFPIIKKSNNRNNFSAEEISSHRMIFKIYLLISKLIGAGKNGKIKITGG